MTGNGQAVLGCLSLSLHTKEGQEGAVGCEVARNSQGYGVQYEVFTFGPG
jgi:hypothetical protein